MEPEKVRFYRKVGVTAFCVIAASMLFAYVLFHGENIRTILASVFGVLSPVVYAACLSYVLWPAVRFLEKKIIYHICALRGWKTGPKARRIIRAVCVVLTLVLFFAAIYGLLARMIPEIIRNISSLITHVPLYMKTAQRRLAEFLKNYPQLEEQYGVIVSTISDKLQTWATDDFLPRINEMLVGFTASFVGALVFIKNFVIGALISVYLLCGKEKYIAHGKHLLYALFSIERANRVIRELQNMDRVFGGFLLGKLLDSLIVGVICYLGTGILGTPYALLVSTVVGVTNIIPYFGPYVGGILCTALILLVNPAQAFYFAIFVLVLQQFDGNILGPKILGDSTGLSGFMVIVAILIGGELFGVIGMLLGVPVCAVLFMAARRAVARRLKKRRLPRDLATYTNMDHLDETDFRPVAYARGETGEELFTSYLNVLRQKLANALGAGAADGKPSCSSDEEETADPENKKEE